MCFFFYFLFFLISFLFVGVLLGTDGFGFCRIWDTQTQIVFAFFVGV